MTKQIRIENACGSDWKVTVETWGINSEGEHILVSSTHLDYPTQMASISIWGTRYLVVKELGPGSEQRT